MALIKLKSDLSKYNPITVTPLTDNLEKNPNQNISGIVKPTYDNSSITNTISIGSVVGNDSSIPRNIDINTRTPLSQLTDNQINEMYHIISDDQIRDSSAMSSLPTLFSQPYIIIRPDDPPIIKNATRFDSRFAPIGSTARDLYRMGKFTASTRGIAWLATQTTLQALNIRAETRVFNPLSLLSSTPYVHISRAMGSESIQGKFYSTWMKSKAQTQSLNINSGGVGSFLSNVANTITSLSNTIGLGIPLINQTLLENYSQRVHLSTSLDITLGNTENPVQKYFRFLPVSYALTLMNRYNYERKYLNGNEINLEIKRDMFLKEPSGIRYDYKFGENRNAIGESFPPNQDQTGPGLSDIDGNLARYFAVEFGKTGNKKYSDNAYTRPEGSNNINYILTKEDGVDLIRTYGYGDYGKPGLDRKDPNAQYDQTDTDDKINSLGYGDELPSGVKDLVPFKIYDVYAQKTIIFRAFINGITDSFSPNYSEKTYIGRPDKVYTYTGNTRTTNFTLKIVAFSKAELKPVWQKINYLVGLSYPHFKNKKMIAPLVKLTLGDIYLETPGFLTPSSVTYDDDFQWELDGNTAETPSSKLPIGATVTLDFIPIGDRILGAKSLHYYGMSDTWQPDNEDWKTDYNE